MSNTFLAEGQSASLGLVESNNLFRSCLHITGKTFNVEICEMSKDRERRLTKAGLKLLESELEPFAQDIKWETLMTLLPTGSITSGETSLHLFGIGGFYTATILGNPGEPGSVYLKAFEVTKGTPLTVAYEKGGKGEYVGWSHKIDERFFSQTEIVIYEGDEGDEYAARFEVWFIPDSGGSERKLFVSIFKIDGANYR